MTFHADSYAVDSGHNERQNNEPPTASLRYCRLLNNFKLCFSYLCLVSADNFSLRKSATSQTCGTLAVMLKNDNETRHDSF